MGFVDKKLDAVNLILGKLNEVPINSLDVPVTGRPDVTLIVNELDTTKNQTLSYGWDCNTVINSSFLVKKSDLTIPVPNNLISIYAKNRRLTIRDRKLFDIDNMSFTFSDALSEVVCILDVDWNDLQTTLFHYIYLKSARKILTTMASDPFEIRVIAQDETEAYTQLMLIENRKSKRFDTEINPQRIGDSLRKKYNFYT